MHTFLWKGDITWGALWWSIATLVALLLSLAAMLCFSRRRMAIAATVCVLAAVALALFVVRDTGRQEYVSLRLASAPRGPGHTYHLLVLKYGGGGLACSYKKAVSPGPVDGVLTRLTWAYRTGEKTADIYPENRTSFTPPPLLASGGFGLDLFGGMTPYGPMTFCQIILPVWCLLALLCVLPGLWLRRSLKRRYCNRHGRCEGCGYDLRASPEKCPECGRPVSAKNKITSTTAPLGAAPVTSVAAGATSAATSQKTCLPRGDCAT